MSSWTHTAHGCAGRGSTPCRYARGNSGPPSPRPARRPARCPLRGSAGAGNEGSCASSPHRPTRLAGAVTLAQGEASLDTLDVVVVGAEWGHGKRRDVLSDLTFAVRTAPRDLVTIGKAYNGLTDAEIRTMTDHSSRHHARHRSLSKRPARDRARGAFDRIQRSARHGAGFALRFPPDRPRPDRPEPVRDQHAARCGPAARGPGRRAASSGHGEERRAQPTGPSRKRAGDARAPPFLPGRGASRAAGGGWPWRRDRRPRRLPRGGRGGCGVLRGTHARAGEGWPAIQRGESARSSLPPLGQDPGPRSCRHRPADVRNGPAGGGALPGALPLAPPGAGGRRRAQTSGAPRRPSAARERSA